LRLLTRLLLGPFACLLLHLSRRCGRLRHAGPFLGLLLGLVLGLLLGLVLSLLLRPVTCLVT
jgi:tetrahydromethanopterin S-methyltransferase subunit G